MPTFWKHEWFLILLASLMSFFGYGGKLWLDKRKAKKKEAKVKRMIDGLRSIATVYQCMEHIHQLEKVGLVYLLEVSNDGDIPKAGSKIYARLIEMKSEEQTFKDRDYYMQRYGEFLIDEQYINMVLEAKQTQEAVKFVTEKSESCLLKTIMIAENVTYAEYYHVYSDTEKWRQYIVGIATKDKDVPDNHEVNAMILNNITQSRYNFKKYR